MTGTATKVKNWVIDPAHSSAEFAVRHMMISTVRGRFNDLEGEIAFDPDDLGSSSVNAAIDTASIVTGDDKRDAHLRSGDFFQSDDYPKMTFESTKIEKAGDDRYSVTGNLTIRDVTHEVTLDVKFLGQILDAFGSQRVGFEARGQINREKFNLTWNQALEAGGVMVGANIDLILNIAAVASE